MLGTKLTLFQEVIYDYSVKLLKENNIPTTLQRIVMEGVYNRFQSNTIAEMSVNSLLEQQKFEEKIGTAADIKRDFNELGGISKNETVHSKEE